MSGWYTRDNRLPHDHRPLPDHGHAFPDEWNQPVSGYRPEGMLIRPDLNHAPVGRNRAYAVAELAAEFMGRGVSEKTAWAWADAEVENG